MEIETPVLLAYAIEDSTDIFRISGEVWTPQTHPLGTPLLPSFLPKISAASSEPAVAASIGAMRRMQGTVPV